MVYGKEAVDLCKNNTNIDIFLMDLKMPVLDEFETTKQIRQFNKKILIIALTAYALAGDKEKALEAGCNYYIAKRVKQYELFSKIQEIEG